ncbi:hypothetical protein H2200_004197 [Cladophialophora chaetospira]|uniref:BRCT domain-containing protein n=1 Tax=Cladophialophora chaetospira TaxID=386627 RepID=A0AA38XFN7_9EURO|nr:hypothetical protein H2200_004197 [Cladophialophora chaetospira]
MPTPHPKHPPPPQPTRILFDPFNSSSTGHQRAENRLSGSTSWRDSRTYKLAHQFKDSSGRGGNQHLSDLVGAGSENFGKDGRKDNGDWEVGAPGLRENGWQDIRDLMSGNRKRTSDAVEGDDSNAKRPKSRDERVQSEQDDANKPKPEDPTQSSSKPKMSDEHLASQIDDTPQSQMAPPQVFRNLVMYLNGSTAPLISDHKLKHIFAQHGGNTSIALGRRTVTHVILGNDLAGGGGLASRKIQKEVDLVRGLGKGVKYVTAQWVIDSVEKGIRQLESRYVPKGVEGRLGGSGQASVRGMFMPKTK